MKKRKLLWTCASLILFFAFPQTNRAQNIETKAKEVVVYLIDGTQLSGYLESWDYGNELIVKINDDRSITIPHNEVDKVVEKHLLELKNNHDYDFKEIGWYHHFRINLIGWNPGRRGNGVPGGGISYTAGYRFKRTVVAGLGISYDQFIFNTAERILSMQGEFSSYLKDSHVSPVVCVSAGDWFAFKNEEFWVTEAKGGWMLHPAFGLRMGKRKTKVTLDIGYKFQKASYTSFLWDTTSEQNITYQRLTIRAGVLF